MDEIEQAINNYRKEYAYKEIDIHINPKFYDNFDENYIKKMTTQKNNIIMNVILPDDVKFIIRKHYELAEHFGNEIKIPFIKNKPDDLINGYILYK